MKHEIATAISTSMEFKAAMKYLQSLILTGLMVHFLPLSAENAQAEHTLPSASSGLIADTEEASLTSLDEELSLLDEEFEEFKEELIALEDAIQKKHEAEPAVVELMPLTPVLEKRDDVAIEQPNASDDKVVAFETELPVASNLPANEIAVKSSFEENPMEIMSDELPLIEPASIDVDVSVKADDYTEAYEEALPVVQLANDTPATLTIEGTSLIGEKAPLNDEAIAVDLKQAFSGSPIIYSILFAMSVISVCIWLYSILSMRSSARVSHTLLKNVQNKLNSNNFDEALSLCEENNTLFCKMVSSGIHSRRHGLPVMIEAMKAEGKRSTISFWQKIGLLNDIAIIAPMLGLLGTVLGMFYAFYDVNRSIESISTLFDGLGISVGTTVAGLIVAILALILHSTAKYRLVRALAVVENEAQSVATLIDDRTSIYKG
ncbi:MAG: MotA/TolQ/ExbB proton channel family protein [Verrucomicrobia bacterium]|nr:MotA/TolQ/ExbB proton channel family protein [Verrucomicrobiota bacterium]